MSNSSPLIALAAIERLELLPALFSFIVVPPAVAGEILCSVPTRPTWLRLQPLGQPLPTAVLRPALGNGEREAIALALEVRADPIILDDLPARRVGRSLGLTVIGTLGILLAAKRRGFLTRIRPALDKLVANSFFLSPQLYDELVGLAGERVQQS